MIGLNRNNKYSIIYTIVWCATLSHILCLSEIKDNKNLKIALTISAQHRKVEISWRNAIPEPGDYLVITDKQPFNFKQTEPAHWTTTVSIPVNKEIEASGDFEEFEGSGSSFKDETIYKKPVITWKYGLLEEDVLYETEPRYKDGWITTDMFFDYALSRNITVHTQCYGYWGSYVRHNGTIVQTTCLRARATWMNDMREIIENLRLRDLFIPGTHDSSSYRFDFHPTHNETIVTKYSLTQDEDIRGQLMHGIRYLDIRVGYYKYMKPEFWGNHGISRQQPLIKILKMVREFVIETNEIVIFDIQEFPVGFGKKLDIHKKLLNLIQREIGDLMVEPNPAWRSTLKQIWATKKNIIVSYDHVSIAGQYADFVWRSVEQKWGNVQHIDDLKGYVFRTLTQSDLINLSSRPVAIMAELTPDFWGIFTDVFGGLRRMADGVNSIVSQWFFEDRGQMANIVAVDFFRGTNIVESALYWNSRKESFVLIN